MKIVDEHVVLHAQEQLALLGGEPITFGGYPGDSGRPEDEVVFDVEVGRFRVTAERHGEHDFRATVRGPSAAGAPQINYQTGKCSSPVVAVMLANCCILGFRLSG